MYGYKYIVFIEHYGFLFKPVVVFFSTNNLGHKIRGNINEKNIILSNEKKKEDIKKYISSLSKYYKINSITIDKEKFDINNLSNNSILQIIPNKKQSNFDKYKYTLFQINT